MAISRRCSSVQILNNKSTCDVFIICLDQYKSVAWLLGLGYNTTKYQSCILRYLKDIGYIFSNSIPTAYFDHYIQDKHVSKDFALVKCVYSTFNEYEIIYLTRHTVLLCLTCLAPVAIQPRNLDTSQLHPIRDQYFLIDLISMGKYQGTKITPLNSGRWRLKILLVPMVERFFIGLRFIWNVFHHSVRIISHIITLP